MTRSKRGGLIVLGVVAGLVAAEVGLNLWKGPEACVQVDNLGAEPIEGLVVSSGSSRAEVPRVAPNGSVRVYLGGTGPRTLSLGFRQRGNSLTNYQLPGFDPALMSQDGTRLILQIQTNAIVRFQDEAEPSTPFGLYARDLWRRFWESLTESA